MYTRAWLEQIEAAGATGTAIVPLVAYVVARSLDLDEEERNAAVRRALLIQAAGGDLRRDPEPDDPAVRTLATDLRNGAAASQVGEALRRVTADAAGLPRVEAAIADLGADDELAWRYVAIALLADELTGHE